MKRILLGFDRPRLCDPSCTSRNKNPADTGFQNHGYRHASIAEGKLAPLRLGQENGFEVDTTEDAGRFYGRKLSAYAAVVFLCTTEDVLNYTQQVAFERYISRPAAALQVFTGRRYRIRLGLVWRSLRCLFESHPEIQVAAIDVSDSSHPATRHLPSRWQRKDEWYNYKK